MSIRRTALVLSLAVAALAPVARGDGGGSLGVMQGGPGVVDTDAGVRFVALWAGRNTVLAKIRLRGGEVGRSRLLRGWWGLPLVTWGGDAGGLSPDRRLLVLADETARRPRATSRFALFDARKLSAPTLIKLRGDFSFDALSPDGTRLYLTQHPSTRDLQRYAVRAYDLGHSRLVRRPVVDPEEPNMRGQPWARVTSRSGSWVYTLYYGGREPFVHALDTAHGHARCLDVAWRKRDGKLWRMKLRFFDGGRKLGFVDRTTGMRARPTLDLHRLDATDS